MYKMVVLDLDGTLLTSDKKICIQSQKDLKILEKNGIIVTVATGRNLINTKHVLLEMGIKVPVICSDGAITYDLSNDEIITEHSFTADEALEIMEIGYRHTGFIEVTTNNHYIKYIKNDESRKYDLNFSHTEHEMSKFLRGIEYREFGKEMITNGDSIHQIILGGNKEDIKKVINELEKLNVVIKDDLWEGYLFIYPKEINKFEGIKELCEYFNIMSHEVVAMGDDLNDIEMIANCGMGIAMGNGNDRVKSIAKFTTETNDNMGVSVALKELFPKLIPTVD